ncbi:MAG TPA: tRNA (N6-threonylcarbamoyladenosine(37)-N6)-methyltransferase TrmO [Methylomirabilota bacterium]|nr:tRNA (N6-threonylcarbamoyladenosine(37)-N6)-methyltransferase TrmO [Methylomirabilota bacterium]
MESPEKVGFSEPDARLIFIGKIRTPFMTRADCPRNVRNARVNGGTARVEVSSAFRPGLRRLGAYSHVILLYWMDEAARDLLVQRPAHLSEERGVFSIRSPARPNPIALAVANLIDLDEAAGVLTVEQLDCRDGTPLIDIKPYYPSIDAVPDAVTHG